MRLSAFSYHSVIRSLNETTSLLATSTERLSTGMRINRTVDDPAGLALASSLDVESRISRQALLNANDGLSLSNVTMGAFEQLTGILQRQQELAEQAANGSYSAAQRQALDTEALKLSDEFNRILASSQFNGTKVFSSTSSGAVTLAVGDAREDTITIPELILGGTSGSSSWDGTFGAQQPLTLAAGNGVSPACADLDGDGDLDVVSGNGTETQVQLFFNNGDGSFTAGATYGVSGAPLAIEALDLNNDGRIDIVTRNDLSSDVTVLLKNAGAGYTSTDYRSTYLGSYGNLATTDFNNDGATDFVAWGDSGDIGVYLNDGSGAFSESTVFLGEYEGFLGNIAHVALGDVTGDGISDMVFIEDGDSNQACLFRGTGDGSFAAPVDLAAPGGNSAKLTDLNDDGKLDLLTTGWDSSIFQVAMGNGDGTFQTAQTYNHGLNTNDLTLADVNGDRQLDVLISGYSSGRAILYLNQGNGIFSSSSATSNLLDSWGVDAGDFNGDGVTDIVTANYDQRIWVSFGGNRSINLPYFDLRTQSTAAKAVDGIKQRLDQVSSVVGQLGAVQSRIDTSIGLLREKSDLLVEAGSRIRNIDVAAETANAVALSIRQQTASSLLAGVKAQDAVIVQTLLATADK